MAALPLLNLLMLLSQTVSLAAAFQVPLIAWSIRLSIACMWLSLLFRCLRLSHHPIATQDDAAASLHQPAPAPVSLELAKHLWLLGALFSVLHAMATMLLVHQGSHVAAWEATAEQTERQLGIAVGIGIYFNYAFVLLWCLDAFWWIGTEASFWRRPKWITATINLFLIFIAFNGTVVFLNSTSRWYWLAAWVILLIFWAASRNRSPRLRHDQRDEKETN